MTTHHRWETTLDQRRRADPGVDDPARRAAARDIRNARDIGYHLAQVRKQRGLTQAEVARATGVSQARVSRMEHGDIEKMRVESVARPTSPPSAGTCAWSPTSTRPPPRSSTTPRSPPEHPRPQAGGVG
ncbi:MAG: helix-turn-helix domain-containing protein [Streptosporangiaceae bacterium]